MIPMETQIAEPMKKSTLVWLILVILANIILLGIGNADAQMPGAGEVLAGKPLTSTSVFTSNDGNATMMSDIICKELNFWTIGSQGEILQWQMSGNAVSFADTIFQSSPMVSLAFADNLNSGALTRTFYGSNFYHGSDLYYYNGQSWDTLFFPGGPGTPNVGGYHSFLYYQSLLHSSYLDAIIRFDGIHEDTLFELPLNRNFAIADIAVDAQGNIWTMEGSQGLQADSVIVINSAGVVVQKFEINLNTTNAYGCFLLNDEFYVVFGSGNPVYPSSLVQIAFSGNQANVQQVIPFPNNDFMDVASCVPGFPLILTTLEKNPDPEQQLSLSPNPASSFLQVHLSQEVREVGLIILYDPTGKEILRKSMNVGNLTLDLEEYSAGLYLIKVIGKEKMYTSRFLKT